MPSSYVSGRVMSDQTEHSRAIIVGYVPSGHYFPACRGGICSSADLSWKRGIVMLKQNCHLEQATRGCELEAK
jgi:hypothetical protein